MKFLIQKNSWILFLYLFLLFGFVVICPPQVRAAAIAVSGKAKVLNTNNSYLDFTNYNSNVTIDDTTGNFTGYAFLEDVGWVDFGSTDNPAGPVNLNLTTGAVAGKAYVLNTAAYLDFTNYNSNISVILATGAFSGYVFSEDVGWLDFSDTGVSSASSFLPTAPSGLAGTADSSTSITWVWTDNSTNETGFKLYDQDDNLIATIAAADTESYQESGLTRGTTYTRYIVAYNSVGNSSSSANASASTNTSLPDSFELKEPGHENYTNSERPTFKWEDSADSDDGLSKYKLEIDNGDSGDFTIDDIPASRTTDYETSKYLIHYENFDDSDTANNYISVYTKSSSDWSDAENGGKLKEGKRVWKVKAVDKAGNEREESRTLFVDRSGPSTEVTQINETAFFDNLATTDQTPTIFGKTTDFLAGDKNDNYIASGPKEVEIKYEKRNYLGLYDLHTLSTVNLNENYWTADGSKINDNKMQTSDKYSAFSYTPTADLPLGTYKVTLIAKDKTGNAGGVFTFTLTVKTYEEIIKIPVVEEVIEELKKEGVDEKEIEEVIKEQGIVVPDELKEPSQVLKTAGSFINKLSNFGGRLLLELSYWPEKINSAKNQAIGQFLAVKEQKTQEKQLACKQNRVYMASKMGLIGDGILAFGSRLESAKKAVAERSGQVVLAWKQSVKSIKFPAAQETKALANRLKVAAGTFVAIVFDQEPTKILSVKIDNITPTSALIIWETNHYATSAVNYGFNTFYGQKIQSDERVKKHQIELTNLEPGKTYYFEVMSQNKNYVYDAYYTFETSLTGGETNE